jgi:hypothetical protein
MHAHSPQSFKRLIRLQSHFQPSFVLLHKVFRLHQKTHQANFYAAIYVEVCSYLPLSICCDVLAPLINTFHALGNKAYLNSPNHVVQPNTVHGLPHQHIQSMYRHCLILGQRGPQVTEMLSLLTCFASLQVSGKIPYSILIPDIRVSHIISMYHIACRY